MDEETSILEAVFLGKARAALSNLFERTRAKDELNFALSLSGEFKTYTYTSAMESQHAFRDFDEFMALDQYLGRPIRLRVAFSYYLYTAESAGLWCIPMAVMGVLAGGHYNIEPFNRWVRKDKASGQNAIWPRPPTASTAGFASPNCCRDWRVRWCCASLGQSRTCGPSTTFMAERRR